MLVCCFAASFDFMGDVMLAEHGAIDMIIDWREMKNHLATLITLLTKQSAIAEIEAA